MSLAEKPDTSRWLAGVLNSPYWFDRYDAKRRVVSECSRISKVSKFSKESLKHIRAAEKELGLKPRFK